MLLAASTMYAKGRGPKQRHGMSLAACRGCFLHAVLPLCMRHGPPYSRQRARVRAVRCREAGRMCFTCDALQATMAAASPQSWD